MVATISAKKRNDLRKTITKQIRMSGQIPAILYGKKLESQAIAVDGQNFVKMIRDHGKNSLVTLSIDQGTQHQVIVHDYQMDPLSGQILHVDFFEVDMKSELDAEVPVRLTGDAIGASEGGIVSQLLHTITVRTLPAEIPEEITVDITNLHIGDSIHIGDLESVMGRKILNAPEETIVTITHQASEKEPAQDPEAVEREAEEKIAEEQKK